jgi:hypothetical protein
MRRTAIFCHVRDVGVLYTGGADKKSAGDSFWIGPRVQLSPPEPFGPKDHTTPFPGSHLNLRAPHKTHRHGITVVGRHFYKRRGQAVATSGQ